MGITVGKSYDPSAIQFLGVIQNRDYTIGKAINELVIDLKNYALWDKMKAVYPFVGQAGVSSSFEVNLKDPNTFRGTFSGSWTFSSTGGTPDGSTGYMNTNFNPLSQSVTKNNFGISFYSRTNSSGNYVDMGAVDGSSYIMLRARNSGTDSIGVYDDSYFFGNYLSNSLGLLTVQRDSSTTQKFYQAGVLKAERTGFAATADINLNLYISARNLFDGTAGTFSNRQCAFAAVHEALNPTEIANYHTAVQRFQTTLGRQV